MISTDTTVRLQNVPFFYIGRLCRLTQKTRHTHLFSFSLVNRRSLHSLPRCKISEKIVIVHRVIEYILSTNYY